MSISFNKWIGAGNLTRDVQSRNLPGGSTVAEFSIAVTDRYKDKSGEWKEETTFVDLVAFARTAEVAAQYLTKGSPVLIEGRLKLESWDDKNGGGKRYKMRVVVEKLQLLGQKQGGGQSSQPSPQTAQRQPAKFRPPQEETPYGEPPSQEGLIDVPW